MSPSAATAARAPSSPTPTTRSTAIFWPRIAAPQPELFDRLRAAESIGRPLGDDRFLARIERLTRRRLTPGKRGPKPKARAGGAGRTIECTVTVIEVTVIAAVSPDITGATRVLSALRPQLCHRNCP
jgi:hypothetical protein